jgi:hypothetical protein
MDTPAQVASEIQARISQLCTFEGDSLKDEMLELKKALKENPAACLLLLPEDIGTMVQHLQKVVGVAISKANEAKEKKETKKKAPKVLSASELQKALNESDEW